VTNDDPTGTGYMDGIPRGTHFCEFHTTGEELADTLVPYFATGLQQDEFCLWVTSDPSGVDGARIGLRKAAPYMDRYLDTGQIEIWDCHDWYLRGGHFDADRVFGQWLEKEKRSLDSGYRGLRVSGDMAWLGKRDWPEFMVYEAEANRVLPQRRMIALCTYSLDGCTADAMLEVIRNHQFALARTARGCEVIERSGFKNGNRQNQTEAVSGQLQPLLATVLEQRDEERRWIATQLHEVTAQNVSAIAVYLAAFQRKRSWSSAVKFIVEKCHTVCEKSVEQILTLSRLLHPLTLDQLGLAACLRQYIEDFEKWSQIHVEFETGPEIGRLPPGIETHLFRVAQEGLSNILRHSGSHNAIVRLHREADEVILQIEDFGRGMPPTAIAAVSGGQANGGLGIPGMQERLRKIGGRLEIRSSSQGTLLTARIRP